MIIYQQFFQKINYYSLWRCSKLALEFSMLVVVIVVVKVAISTTQYTNKCK